MRAFTLILIILFLAACASKSGLVHEESGVQIDVNEYDRIILSVTVADPSLEFVAEKLKMKIDRMLTDEIGPKLGRQKIKNGENLGINIEVTYFEPGNDFMHYFLHFGGHAEVRGKGTLVDLDTEDVINNFSFSGNSRVEKARWFWDASPVVVEPKDGAITGASWYITNYLLEVNEVDLRKQAEAFQ